MGSTLLLRKRPDGSLELTGDAPEWMIFSERWLMKQALQGIARVESGSEDVPLVHDVDPGNGVDFQPRVDEDDEPITCGKDDLVILTLANATLHYRVIARHGDVGEDRYDGWHAKCEKAV